MTVLGPRRWCYGKFAIARSTWDCVALANACASCTGGFQRSQRRRGALSCGHGSRCSVGGVVIASESSAGTSKIRVLIVDDHELVRAGLRALLEGEDDLEVVAEAATGGQALARAERLRPSVVLLDARLPDMAGPDVCRALYASVPGVVVAMLTTFTDDELVRQSVRAGALGYLLKEIPRLDLAASIRALAAGESVVDRGVLPQGLGGGGRAGAAAEGRGAGSEGERGRLRRGGQ